MSEEVILCFQESPLIIMGPLAMRRSFITHQFIYHLPVSVFFDLLAGRVVFALLWWASEERLLFSFMFRKGKKLHSSLRRPVLGLPLNILQQL